MAQKFLKMVLYNYYCFRSSKGNQNGDDVHAVINIAVTSCGPDRIKEAITMVKSAILFSQHTRLRVFVFADNDTVQILDQKVHILKIKI